MNAYTFAPGLAPGMSNDDYHNGPGISKSHLDDVAPETGNSPKHYWAKRIDPQRKPVEKTEALIMGDAIDKAVFEPDLIESNFAVTEQDAPRRPSITQLKAKNPSAETMSQISYWQDFDREHQGKVVLKPEAMKIVLACRDAVHTHPVAKHLFSGGEAQQTFFAIDRETGALTKCRTDYERIAAGEMIVDLKTTEAAGEHEFGRSATKYRYDVQGAWYKDVIHSAYGPGLIKHFVFVAVEKDPPHAVGIYHLLPEDEAEGRALARRDLHRIVDCQRAAQAGEEFPWPDFGLEPRPLRIRRARGRQ